VLRDGVAVGAHERVYALIQRVGLDDVGDYLVDPSKKVVFIDGRTIERDWVVLGKKIELTEFGFHNAEILKKECRLFKANYKRQN